MKKVIVILCMIAMVIPVAACGRKPLKETEKNMTTQKEVARIARYDSEIPQDYAWFDYRKKAVEFDSLVFDENLQGTYLPLMWQDQTNNTFGFAAYVGDGRFGQDGSQEGVAAIAAVLSGTLMGIDKSNQNGVNYVEQLHAYYSETEGIVLNNPGGISQNVSMWYMLYPAILFTEVSRYYPDEAQIRQDALECVEKWYEAYLIMKETGTYAYTGFDFTTMQPWENGIWKEPDCVAGIAVLLKFGYEMEGKAEYAAAIEECLNYLSAYEGSPLYEVLLYFAPALAAERNAKYGTDYNIDDILGDVLNGSSIPRGGWGQINGIWGEYSVNGLMGSTTDGGGYAFSMNTFAGGYALAPLAKYDTRYAKAAAIWFLNAASAARYFFPGETAAENQSAYGSEDTEAFLEVAEQAVPYEGIRKSANSKTPWVGGDPTVYGWAETDLSLYSGAHTGMFAAAFEKTNVEKILKINCNMDNAGTESFSAYLLYNPYEKEQKVSYQLPSGTWDLFDSVEKSIVVQEASGEIELKLLPKQAMVLIEVPSGSEILHAEGQYTVNGSWIASDTVTVAVGGYSNNDEVKGKVELDIQVMNTNQDTEPVEIILEIEGQEYVYQCGDAVTFQTGDFSEGSKNVNVTVKMSDGKKDTTGLRLYFRH